MSDSYGNTSRAEGIVILKHGSHCPESWWAQPGTRDEFYDRWRQRVPAMKKQKQVGYGRADGVDAQ